VTRLGVLGSGKGSNFVAIAEAIDRGELQAEIAIVLSDVADAGILSKAKARGLPAEHVPPGKFRTKMEPEAEEALVSRLRAAKVDWVVLAGFMRMLKTPLLEAFEGRIVNIHPSLLPAFPGLEAWRQALEYGVQYTGCTVHFVTPEMDAGPIVAQAVVPVQAGDTAEALHERIQQEEHRLYPRALQALAAGSLTLRGRGVLRT